MIWGHFPESSYMLKILQLENNQALKPSALWCESSTESSRHVCFWLRQACIFPWYDLQLGGAGWFLHSLPGFCHQASSVNELTHLTPLCCLLERHCHRSKQRVGVCFGHGHRPSLQTFLLRNRTMSTLFESSTETLGMKRYRQHWEERGHSFQQRNIIQC